MSEPRFEKEFANANDAAHIMGLHPSTLCRMRTRHHVDGPPWFRCGGTILYPISDLRQWAARRIETNMGAGR